MGDIESRWSVFVNPGDGRPRAGWRLALQVFVLILLLTFWQVALSGWPGSGHLLYIVYGGIITLSVWIAASLFDRRKLSEYGLSLSASWGRDFLFGTILGLAAMLALFLIYLGTGWAEFNGWGWERSQNNHYLITLSGYFLMMLAVGFYEELLFRGYQTKNLAEGLRTGSIDNSTAAFSAVMITAIFFGLMHAWNPYATWISTFNIALAGVLLGLPYILTNSLALPIGLHFSWNFFQGGLFGFPVSGNPPRESVIQLIIEGPEWITGDRFGPEGGITGSLMIILLIFVVLYYYRQLPAPEASPTFTQPPEILDTQQNQGNG